MKLGIKPLSEQQELVMRLRKEEGMTYREIAEGLRVSSGRVQQIYAEARRRLAEHEEDPRESLVLLPVRVRTVLENFNLHSRSQILAAFESGELWCDSDWWSGSGTERARLASQGKGTNLARMRNFGKDSWLILEQWLGFRTAEEQQEREKRRAEELERRRAEQAEQRRKREEEKRTRPRPKLERWKGED